MKSGNVLLGILAGISAGTLLGILIAPNKGSRTRKMILDKGEDYADALKDKVEELSDMVETITDKYQSVRDDIQDLVTKDKVKYDGVKRRVHV